MDVSKYDVFCGIDVGKSAHYAVALDPQGARLAGIDLAQDESAIRSFLCEMSAYG